MADRSPRPPLLLHDHVLAASMLIANATIEMSYRLGVTTYSSWPNLPETHHLWSSYCQTLAGAVVEAISNAWSVTLEEVLDVSDFSTNKRSFKREIGLCDGKPVIRPVDIIRKPKSIQSKLS